MRKPEQRLYDRFRAGVSSCGGRWHIVRVENAAGVGDPDVDFCIDGVEGGIELKARTSAPVRETTPALGDKNGLRKDQIVWAVERCNAGGRVFLLAQIGVVVVLIRLSSTMARRVNKMTFDELVSWSVWVGSGSISTVEWADLRAALIE